MGLELRAIVEDNLATHAGLGTGLTLAACALTLILVVRALYVWALVWLLGRRAHDQRRERLRALSGRLDRIATAADPRSSLAPGARRPLGWTRAQIERAIHDIDYYQATPLGWRHGVVIVWAGMRGVVTLAAAQTLPRDPTVDRSLLVFVAFMVAAGSLVLQGLTLPWVIRRLDLTGEGADPIDAAAQSALDEELRAAALDALADPSLRRRDGGAFPAALMDQARARVVEPPPADPEVGGQDRIELRLALIGAMRRRLSELATGGAYSSAVLRQAFAELDADQVSLELRLERDE
jgi:CPA1 family monovalent cation:H+ antiporter